MADNIMGLPDGYRLRDYEIESVLETSESTIKYAGIDHSQQRRVAISEFLPGYLALRNDAHTVVPKSSFDESSFNELLKQFLDEAKALSEWHHPNVVKVYETFRANGTGYAVMERTEGQSLAGILDKVETVPDEPLQNLLHPLLDCLEAMHQAGLQHQHIRPDSVVVGDDGSPILLARGLAGQGFSAARQAFGDRARTRRASSSHSVYAPLEMYSSSALTGPWTDIYALGATLYHCVTGAPPPPAPDRVIEDTVAPAAQAARDLYRAGTLAGIDAALATRPTDRPRSVAVWREVLTGRAPGRHAHRLHSDLQRTAARGSRLPAANVETASIAVGRRQPWIVPAVALTAVTAVIAYVDTGILRSPTVGPVEIPGVAEVVVEDSRANQVIEPASIRTASLPNPDAEVAEAEGLGTSAAEQDPPLQADATAEGTSLPLAPAKPPSDIETTAMEQPLAVEGLATASFAEAGEPIGPALADVEEPAQPAQAFRTGTLVVETEPSGAEVLLAGEIVGTTPMQLEGVAEGTYDILLRHPYYENVELVDEMLRDSLRIDRTLTRARGGLEVMTEPYGAWVEWNGRRLTEATPETLRDLPAGPIELTLGAPGHLTVQVQTEVPKGSTGAFRHTLEIAYGTLTLELLPDDSLATIETAGGERLPYRRGMRLAEGEHRLEVSRTGYATAERTVAIGGDTVLAIALEADPPPPIPAPTAPEEQQTVAATNAIPECVLQRGRNRLVAEYPTRTRGQAQIKDTATRRTRNIGEATIAVVFSVDDEGRVVDGSVTVDRERSTASQPQYFDSFARTAIRSVRGYRFGFVEPDSGECRRAQEAVVAFRFSYN